MSGWVLLLPKVAIVAAVLVALVIDSLPAGRPRRGAAVVVLGLTVAGAVFAGFELGSTGSFWHGALVVDRFSVFADLVLLSLAAVLVLASLSSVGAGAEAGDFLLLVFLSLLGASALAAAGNLIALFLAVELGIIPTWALVAFKTGDRRSFEAALKYFLLAIFASALLFYGLSLVYGATGSIDLPLPAHVQSTGLLLAGLGLVLVGFGFELATFPFHQWLPDVFEVAHGEVAAFLAVAPKLTAIVALSRLLSGLTENAAGWTAAVAVLSLITMFWGNVVAFAQTSLRRLVAYSAIAHSGYALVGIAAGNLPGYRGAVLYFAAYASGAVGVFLVAMLLEREGYDDRLVTLAGLGKQAPWLAAALTVSLLSLIGIPLFAGFWGKFSVFWGAVQGGKTWLAVFGVVNAAIALGYYGRIIQRVYMEPSAEAVPAAARPALAVEGLQVGVAADATHRAISSGHSFDAPVSAAVDADLVDNRGPGPLAGPLPLRVALALAVVVTVLVGVLPRLLFAALG
jgi:NADH-quinone oxidoreductase subunit N